MRVAAIASRTAIGVAIAMAHAAPAAALPTMIRLGYTGCATCHVAPQGGGVLNDYGRGIDQAQSLRGGEYRAPESPRRVVHDLRAVFQQQATWAATKTPNVFRPRLMYRNIAELSPALRVSGTVTFEGATALRPSRSYDPATPATGMFVNTALVHYRPGETVEIAAGRDQLPSGINIPDLSGYIKSRNRLGFYDSPTQIKVSWGGKRHHVIPFAFAPGGNEIDGEHESGGGTLAEFDVLGHQKTVVGMTVLRGVARNGDRRMLGGYARLGFGGWGILAEHDVTDRTRRGAVETTFRQNATYAQVFWAAREWLVLSTTAERLRIAQPFEERMNAGRFDVAARLAPQATVTFGTRVERNLMTGRLSKSLILQLAVKTVH